MALPIDKQRAYAKRLLTSRLRILSDNGFYGLLLMHLDFGLDESCDTAYTDSENIMFNPKFMDELSDSELDFVLMHEVLHVALRHCFRLRGENPYLANIATDIVVNSNIMHSCNDDKRAITIEKYGESMHYTPYGQEGYNYTAEEVYDMIIRRAKETDKDLKDSKQLIEGNSWDDHSKWKEEGEKIDKEKEEKWKKIVEDAYTASEAKSRITGKFNTPKGVEILMTQLKEPQIDWRQILNSFIQEEVVDYSFMPPDKRYIDTGFFLPDYNEVEETPKNILFMIDTSGSMSREMVTEVFSEVKGALDQFDGKLKGYLGFFDAGVVPPVEFNDVDELKKIKPYGGGGTDFNCVFQYVKHKMSDNLPASIIILTDGEAEVPPEKEAMGIPVLWVLNNKSIEVPWGMVARIKHRPSYNEYE